jgi:hypothetical protein
MVAAALAAGAVLTACGGPVKLGAATLMNNGRISASTLSAEVANLNANYQKYKGQIQLQYEVSQMPQGCCPGSSGSRWGTRWPRGTGSA